MSSAKEITKIKEILRALLGKLGGSATVRELRQSYFNEYYREIDPWVNFYTISRIREFIFDCIL